MKPRIVYSSTKLSSFFSLKDTIKTQHKHDLVYKYRCSAENCNSNYIGETSRRFKERIMDHQRRDKKSHVYQHSINSDHPPATESDFVILEQNCGGYRRRKITEALCIRDEKPSLNKQDQSVTLSLFS